MHPYLKMYKSYWCCHTQPKRIVLSRHTIFVSQKLLHLQSSLNEVNQAMIAWSYYYIFFKLKKNCQNNQYGVPPLNLVDSVSDVFLQ